MSADPRSTLSQIWQNFGTGISVDEISADTARAANGIGSTSNSNSTSTSTDTITNGFGMAPATIVSKEPAKGTSPSISKSDNNNSNSNGNSGNNNNDSNYVNFDQFIMQHNLFGRSLVNGQQSPQYAQPLQQYVPRDPLAGGDFTAYGGSFENSFFSYPATASIESSNGCDSYQSTNVFNPNSNLFPCSDSNSTGIYANGMMNYNIYQRPTYGAAAAYSSFGTSPNFIVNPFATGFSFNISNLQASAPEFVPRLQELSLNDTKGEAEGRQNEALVAPQLPDVLQQSNGIAERLPEASVGSELSRSTNAKSLNSGSISANSVNNTTSTNTSNSNNTSTSRASNGATSNGSRPPSAGAGSARLKHPLRPSSANGSETNDERSQGIGEKSSPTEAGRDNRRLQNGRRQMDYHEREDRFDRFERAERGERSERGHNHRGNRDRDRDRDRDYYSRYDNHRSNKRRDDWNRNRDRINGFRVEEKYSNDNGKDSPILSPEKKVSPKKVYPENEKLSQREKLMRDIELRRLECLVCVEHIKSHHAAWSCQICYHIMHLQCIIKWASSSKVDGGWRCPACQNVLKDVPRDYYCFCGKLKNPVYNRQEIAHSCGEVCGRIENCQHACTLLCHPGPCPPCQANVKRECGCGKTTKIMQCCLKEAFECDAKCEKLLNCESHRCEAKCHAGKCAPCDKKVKQQCHCSKQEREVACTRDSHDKRFYSCGKPCGKDLACGNHKCKDCCHAGECRPCKLSPDVVTACPCGKMTIVAGQRQSCLDPIPVCEGVCGKTLRCGKPAHPHHCTSKCHLGNCPPCNKQTAVKCRCGHMDQLIKCRQLSSRADDARCKKRCVKKRSCGKHKCNQECCIDIDHICPLPCNYTLSCGKHKCDQPCHRGNCPPCYRSSFDELYCECGAEVIYPPVPCGTKRPFCKRPCSRSHPCSHTPQHNCHSASTCPPCMMFTTKWCYGHHEQRKTIPCSQESFSCGFACNKPLACGRHKCIRSCHEGNCQAAGEVCKQSCTTLRASCGHKCMAPCHDGECPETPCKEMVEVQCECGNRKQMRACHDLAREYSRIATAQLASSMAEMQRGNYMELSEILAPVKLNKTNKTLDCNEECRVLERNRRLEIGLQIRNPDLPQKLTTKYSDFIRNFAKRDPVLVKSVHDALTNLVKLAKESKQKSRSHSFPTMNREKRQLVHEMCEMFGVESVAYDAEPNRNVVATAYREKSWLPAASILEVIKRESGQRRVPVPSNNAWGSKR